VSAEIRGRDCIWYWQDCNQVHEYNGKSVGLGLGVIVGIRNRVVVGMGVC